MAANAGYYDVSGLFVCYTNFNQSQFFTPPTPIVAPPKKRLEFIKKFNIDPEINFYYNDIKDKISEEDKKYILEFFTQLNISLFPNKNINVMDLYLLWSLGTLPDKIKSIVAPIFQDSKFYITNYFWGLFPVLKEMLVLNNINYEDNYIQFTTLYILWFIMHLWYTKDINTDALKPMLVEFHYEMSIKNGNYRKIFGNEKLYDLMYSIVGFNKFDIIQNDSIKNGVKEICTRLRYVKYFNS